MDVDSLQWGAEYEWMVEGKPTAITDFDGSITSCGGSQLALEGPNSFTTSMSGLLRPAPPEIISFSPSGPNVPPGPTTILMDWTDVVGATYYRWRIDPATAEIGGMDGLASSNINVGPVTLNPGTTYIQYVRACNGSGNCSADASRAFTTSGGGPPPPPPPPPPPGGDGDGLCPIGGIFCIDNPLNAKNFEELINTIINFIFFASLVIAPLMVVVAGFFLVTSGGDPKRFQTAKDIILYTFVGLLIVFLAKGLISAILGSL